MTARATWTAQERSLLAWFGVVTRSVRLSCQLSQEEMAATLDFTRMVISHLETGSHATDLRIIQRIATLLNIPMWVLLRAAETRNHSELGMVRLEDQAPDEHELVLRLGAALRAMRITRDMPLSQLAQTSRLSRNTVSGAELGNTALNLVTLMRLATALNIPAWVLLRAAEERKPSIALQYLEETEPDAWCAAPRDSDAPSR
jgi:transcriptional regulator with XRE-family HTH domain